jgi:hypothetical protein
VDPTSQIIVALDCDNRATAEAVVERLGEQCRFYKVGLELLTAVGPDIVERLVAQGKQVPPSQPGLPTSSWAARSHGRRIRGRRFAGSVLT